MTRPRRFPPEPRRVEQLRWSGRSRWWRWLSSASRRSPGACRERRSRRGCCSSRSGWPSARRCSTGSTWRARARRCAALAEATLALVLFTDASRIDLGALRRTFDVPVRLLGLGLPLILLGAALGQAVVTEPRVPARIRQGPGRAGAAGLERSSSHRWVPRLVRAAWASVGRLRGHRDRGVPPAARAPDRARHLRHRRPLRLRPRPDRRAARRSLRALVRTPPSTHDGMESADAEVTGPRPPRRPAVQPSLLITGSASPPAGLRAHGPGYPNTQNRSRARPRALPAGRVGAAARGSRFTTATVEDAAEATSLSSPVRSTRAEDPVQESRLGPGMSPRTALTVEAAGPAARRRQPGEAWRVAPAH